VTGCVSNDGLDDARRKYAATADYASLRKLAGHLKEGMSREEVEALLGGAGYSPIDGQCVYGTDREELVEEPGVKWTVYLVLAFRDSRRNATDELQGWGFHPLGE
jgi:hypothetical protein